MNGANLIFDIYLQLSELEQRVIEAEERAEEAEDKVSLNSTVNKAIKLYL